MDGHYKVLEWLIKNNKTEVELTYNTNLSTLSYKNYNVFDLCEYLSNEMTTLALTAGGATYTGLSYVWTYNVKTAVFVIAMERISVHFPFRPRRNENLLPPQSLSTPLVV